MPGFVINFTLDGRVAAKKGELEYHAGSGSKIEAMIMHVLDVIGRLKKKQEDRMKKMKVVTRR